MWAWTKSSGHAFSLVVHLAQGLLGLCLSLLGYRTVESELISPAARPGDGPLSDQFLNRMAGFVIDGVGDLQRASNGVQIRLGPVDTEGLVEGGKKITDGDHAILDVGTALVAFAHHRPPRIPPPPTTSDQHSGQ